MASDKHLQLVRQMLENAENSLAGAKKLLAELTGETQPVARPRERHAIPASVEGKVVEGVFDGQNMIGPDGKIYSVPANYASKSKLVEGDALKLTIAADGSFVYKQIGPVERRRVIGKLVRDPVTDEFMVAVEGGTAYKVLRASITYFKGEEADEIVVLMPKNAEARWVAVENIIKPSLDPLALTDEVTEGDEDGDERAAESVTAEKAETEG